MDEQPTNGAPDRPGWWQGPSDTDTLPGWPPTPAPVVVAPPPPPPAPPTPQARPVPVTSAHAHIQPPETESQPATAWPPHPPESPPLAERAPAQPPAKRPRAEVEKPAEESPAATIRGRWGATSRRYRWAMVAVGAVFVLLVGNVIVGRVSNQIGAGVAKPMADLSADFKTALEKQGKPQSGVQTIIEPTSFLACPFSADAAGLIGYDATTNFKTVDPARAAGVAEQVKSLLAYHALTDLWIHSQDATTLVVTVGGPSGVPLVNCAPGNVPAQQSSTTSTPTTPTTAGR